MRNVLTDHTNTVTRGKGEVIRLQQPGIAEVHVDLAGSSLDHNVRPKRSSRRIFREAYHRALQRNLSADFVSAHLLRSALRVLLRGCAYGQ